MDHDEVKKPFGFSARTYCDFKNQRPVAPLGKCLPRNSLPLSRTTFEVSILPSESAAPLTGVENARGLGNSQKGDDRVRSLRPENVLQCGPLSRSLGHDFWGGQTWVIAMFCSGNKTSWSVFLLVLVVVNRLKRLYVRNVRLRAAVPWATEGKYNFVIMV